MERRAKLKIARWAGPVLGSLLMSGCGAGGGPAPPVQTTPYLSVEMPQLQEFGGARPLGYEDYRSPAVLPAQYPALERVPPTVESGPIASMPATMPSVPWNSSMSAEPAQELPIADAQGTVLAAEPDSVSIEEYLANRSQAQALIEPDSVSIEDYMALRAKLQAESALPKSPVVETNRGEYDPTVSGGQSIAEASPIVERHALSELPDFPTSAAVETPSPNVASDALPASRPRADDPAIYTPSASPIAPAEQEVMVERLPNAVVSPEAGAPEVGDPKSDFGKLSPEAVAGQGSVVGNQRPEVSDQTSTSSASSPLASSVQGKSQGEGQVSMVASSRTVRTPVRTPEMNGVVRDAEKHNGRGFDLATRGALMAARREFIEGLRLIALQLDKDAETRHFTQALAAGLAALDEADDFSPRGSRFNVEVDLPLLVRGHRTPVLKGEDVKDLSPLVAAGRYYTYAQEQLGMAAGGEMSGSLALYGLGKVHDMINEQRLPKFNAPLPKAMVFHQAALTTDPRNFRAANDLGVLLARAGRLEIAKAMLEHSLRVTSQPAVWRNLAAVHDQLGETQFSARAQQLAAASQAEGAKAFPPGANPNTSRFAVQWVDPATFAASSRAASDIQPPAPASSPADLNNLPPPAKAPKAAASWSPWGKFPAAAAPPADGPKGLFTR